MKNIKVKKDCYYYNHKQTAVSNWIYFIHKEGSL